MCVGKRFGSGNLDDIESWETVVKVRTQSQEYWQPDLVPIADGDLTDETIDATIPAAINFVITTS